MRNIVSLPLKANIASLAVVVSLGSGSLAIADPAQECSQAAQRWATAYTSNNVDAIIQNYTRDAILFGTNSAVLSDGEAGVRQYFSRSPGSGNSVKIGEHQSRTVDAKTAFATGFYNFTIFREGKATPQSARFSMICVLDDGQWRIAHHHSSVLPATR